MTYSFKLITIVNTALFALNFKLTTVRYFDKAETFRCIEGHLLPLPIWYQDVID